MTSTKVLWRRPALTLANAWVLLPIGLSLCILGLPLAARALRTLAGVYLDNARDLLAGRDAPALKGLAEVRRARRARDAGHSGSIALVGLFTFGLAGFAVVAVASHLTEGGGALYRFVAMLLAGVLGALGLGAALGPLLFAPIVAVDGVRGMFAPFTRSFELAAQRGPRATARTGVVVGARLAFPFACFALAAFLGFDSADRVETLMLLAPLAAVVAAPRALAQLALTYARSAEAPADEAESPAGSGRSLRGLVWLIAPAPIALLLALLAAALVPLPMRTGTYDATEGRGLRGIHPTLGVRAGRLPGTSVTIRADGDGIVIEAADGGGAGELEAGFETRWAYLQVEQRTRGGEPLDTYRITVTDGERWARTEVDSDGVRLDDSFTDRTFGRLGVVGSAGLGIALLLLLFLSFTMGAELGAARRLGAPALLEGGPRAEDDVAALEGTLRVGDDAAVRYHPRASVMAHLGDDRGTLVLDGDVWFEAAAGAFRFRLPPKASVIGADADALGDGAELVLLSRFEDPGLAGPRRASAPFPDDGRLVLGTLADARGALVKRTIRRAALVALPTVAGFGVAIATVLLALAES